MGFFDFIKREKVLDLTKEEYQGNTPLQSEQTNDSEEEVLDLSSNPEDKKKRLAKRLADMTEKIEELSNQVYLLQQRIEVLERKSGIQSEGE